MISVIIPTLNEESFIEKCINSFSDQTLPRKEFEVIVSDSSSDDSTVEIAKSLADKVVECKRVSAGFGRNFGAKHAKGNLLAFIDADSIVSPTYLEGVKESLENSIASTGPIRALEKESLFLRFFYRWWSFQSNLSTALKHPVFPGFSFAVKKDVFDKAGGFLEYNMTSEDIELSMRLRKYGRISFNRKMLVHTSARRFQEVGFGSYFVNGFNFFLFGKSHEWEKHRSDF